MPTLQWLTRGDDIIAAQAVPYRLLEEVPELGYGASETGNMLVQGDNLEALKALLPFYAGRVNCIYIDPPYNTRSAFEHYDDNLEHTQWLAMMWPRLILLREFLSEQGTIWVSIDDNEAHYLKVVLDEIFGRKAFVADVIWRSSDAANNDAKTFSLDHNHTLVYARSNDWLSNPLPRTDAQNHHYKNPDNDPKGPWFAGNLYSPKPIWKSHSMMVTSSSITCTGMCVDIMVAGCSRNTSLAQITYPHLTALKKEKSFNVPSGSIA